MAFDETDGGSFSGCIFNLDAVDETNLEERTSATPPEDTDEIKYWYDLSGNSNTFEQVSSGRMLHWDADGINSGGAAEGAAGDVLYCTNKSLVRNLSGLTFGCVFKYNDTASFQYLFRAGTGDATFNNRFAVYVDTSDKLNVVFRNGDSQDNSQYTIGSALTGGQEYILVVSIDCTGQHFEIYLDDTSLASASLTGTANFSDTASDENPTIFAADNSATNSWDGHIALMVLYDNAFNDSDASALHDAMGVYVGLVEASSDIESTFPSPADISLAAYAPTATITADFESTFPSPADISLEAYAPTATITENSTATFPSPADIGITAYAPTATITQNIVSNLPEPADISLTAYAPTVTIEQDIESTFPSPADISLEAHAPTVTITQNIETDFPEPADISIEANAPTATITANITATFPEPAAISLEAFAPTATITGDIESTFPEPASITIEAHAPTATITGEESETSSGASAGGSRLGKRGHWEDTKLPRIPKKRKRKRKRKKKTPEEKVLQVLKTTETTTQKLIKLDRVLRELPDFLRPELFLRKSTTPPKYSEPEVDFELYSKLTPFSIFGLPSPYAPLPQVHLEPDPNVEIPVSSKELLETRSLLTELDPEFASYDDDTIRAIHIAIYDQDISA